jgi:hypothetical protein
MLKSDHELSMKVVAFHPHSRGNFDRPQATHRRVKFAPDSKCRVTLKTHVASRTGRLYYERDACAGLAQLMH